MYPELFGGALPRVVRRGDTLNCSGRYPELLPYVPGSSQSTRTLISDESDSLDVKFHVPWDFYVPGGPQSPGTWVSDELDSLDVEFHVPWDFYVPGAPSGT